MTGLPLIMCLDCKDMRVFAATTTQSEYNVGKSFFKCPRKNNQNVSVIIILDWPNFILVGMGMLENGGVFNI